MKKFKEVYCSFRLVLLIQMLLFSTLLFAQTGGDAYGVLAGGMKKLQIKIQVKTFDGKVTKGYLNALKDNSIQVSRMKFVRVNKKETEVIEFPISQITKIRLSNTKRILNKVLLLYGCLVSASILINGINEQDNNGLVLAFFSALSITAFVIIVLKQTLKVDINGNLEQYTSRYAEIKSFLAKKGLLQRKQKFIDQRNIE